MADAKDLMQRYCDGDATRVPRALRARRAAAARLPDEDGARSRAVADDLLQQTFLKVHRARARLRPRRRSDAVDLRDRASHVPRRGAQAASARSSRSATTTSCPRSRPGSPASPTIAATSPRRSRAGAAALDALAELPDAAARGGRADQARRQDRSPRPPRSRARRVGRDEGARASRLRGAAPAARRSHGEGEPS